MAIQHHFVVVVEDGKLWIDDDTTDHKFYEGSVWNTEIEDWEANYEYAQEYLKAQEALWNRLNLEMENA
jgi:L-rhamnose isomerase